MDFYILLAVIGVLAYCGHRELKRIFKLLNDYDFWIEKINRREFVCRHEDSFQDYRRELANAVQRCGAAETQIHALTGQLNTLEKRVEAQGKRVSNVAVGEILRGRL